LLSLQESMQKKPLTQISFDFEDLAAVPDPTPVNSNATTAVEESTPPAVAPTLQAVPEKEEVVAESLEESGVRIRAIRKKEVSTAGKRGRKSMREMASRIDQLQVPADEELFKKQYYTIGEVAKMFQENQSLIRYWESEFDILQPRKNKKGDRYFRPIDVKNLVLIYDLLRRRKFTIDGARDFLKKNKKAEEKFALIQSLQQLRGFLVELRSNL
jgi:DNA-binding transcriptional MerR regulator